MNLHGIASRLDRVHTARVLGIWDRLEAACGLDGVRRTPIPHLSWMIGEEFDFDGLERVLSRQLAGQKTLRIRTTGLGIFTGSEDIVLYIAVIKDDRLSEFHRILWESARECIRRPAEYYLPNHWVPHITLAHGDVDPAGLACAAQLLAREDLHWSIDIGDVSLVYQDDTEAEERSRIILSDPS